MITGLQRMLLQQENFTHAVLGYSIIPLLLAVTDIATLRGHALRFLWLYPGQTR